MSGVTCLGRLPVGPILECPETTELFRGVMAEVAAVGRARGVGVPDERGDHWFNMTTELNPTVYGSMYHDLAAGRRLEVEALNGTVVRLGRNHGVPTPLNFAIFSALRPHADGTPKLRARGIHA